jgi:hypothetical protein
MIDKHCHHKNFFIFIIFLLIPLLIRCQCESNWFGRNCSEPNLCNYNNSSLCPDGFICKITDENQECKLKFYL